MPHKRDSNYHEGLTLSEPAYVPATIWTLFPILLLPFPLFFKKVSFHYNSYYFSLCYIYLSLKLSQRFFFWQCIYFWLSWVFHAAWTSLWLWQVGATL